VQRQFDTATNWGRYAEIFDYDRESGRLVQTEALQTEAPQTEAAPVEALQTKPTPTAPASENHDSTPAPKA
ncbi:MAG: hypothetical protein WBW77_14495, partial [Candidatus Sulfotelmatobacter sp.]